jgi:GT2 family glycosyltransferase
MAIVSVIIPVYKQAEITKQCVRSVLASENETQFRLILIDDASCDTELTSFLKSIDDPRVQVIVNDENLGFTKTVNKGMQLFEQDDVVLLNSDTVVYHQWLDKLYRAAYSTDRVASVNPLTNASHISCYPHREPVEEGTLEVSGQELNFLASTCNRDLVVQVHTTVGFCMYITRPCLVDIGYFDDVEFPVGYGEESDFCYRARRMGWKHLVAGDVYVSHLEGKSFGSRKAQLIEKMLHRFRILHPDFPEWDARFANDNPLKHLKLNLDIARCRRVFPNLNTIRVYFKGMEENTSVPYLILDRDNHLVEFIFPKIRHIPNIPKITLEHDNHLLYYITSSLGVKTIFVPLSGSKEFLEPNSIFGIELIRI